VRASGLGGSCVAALIAANALLDAPLDARRRCIRFAMEGEYASSRSHQGDNVGPMLIGGVALATATRLMPLHAPTWLHASSCIRTRCWKRSVRAKCWPNRSRCRPSCAHGARLAQFLLGLERGDVELIRDGLQDVLVEPRARRSCPASRQ
jgi:homoserine kinase